MTIETDGYPSIQELEDQLSRMITRLRELQARHRTAFRAGATAQVLADIHQQEDKIARVQEFLQREKLIQAINRLVDRFPNPSLDVGPG